jgi:plastocyanin
MLACATAPPVPTPAPAQEQRVLATATLVPTATSIPATPTPAIGFTPEATQRNSAGVPLPNAPGARSVVVTYTPVADAGIQVKSGFVTVGVGDNYFLPDEVHVTTGTIVEWQYDGGGGETESIHNVIALNKAFNSGDLNPGTRFSFTFSQPGEYDYVCTYHPRQMTAKIVVQ